MSSPGIPLWGFQQEGAGQLVTSCPQLSLLHPDYGYTMSILKNNLGDYPVLKKISSYLADVWPDKSFFYIPVFFA